MKLIVDERMWSRGEGSPGMLYSSKHHKLCMLGFYCLACGISKEEMDGIGTPSTLFWTNWNQQARAVPESMEWLMEDPLLGTKYRQPSRITYTLAEINDSQHFTDEERKQLITGIFGKIGVEVVFTTSDVIKEAQGPAEGLVCNLAEPERVEA